MMEYMRRYEFYEGDDMDVVVDLALAVGEKNIVFVTYDESAFYSNLGKNNLWLLKGEKNIRKKDAGSSNVISEFQCPCHGTMRSNGRSSRIVFKVGTHRKGWWTIEETMNQLKNDAIPIFDELHPGCAIKALIIMHLLLML